MWAYVSAFLPGIAVRYMFKLLDFHRNSSFCPGILTIFLLISTVIFPFRCYSQASISLLFLIKVPITYWLCKLFQKWLTRRKVHYFRINSQSGSASSQPVGPESCEPPPAALHKMHTLNIQTIHMIQEQLLIVVSPKSEAIFLGSQQTLLLLIDHNSPPYCRKHIKVTKMEK